MKSKPNAPAKVNSLRIEMRELNALLDRIEQTQNRDASPDREHVRWSFRVNYAELTIEHAGGSSVMIPVATRNLSRGGISVLHSSFVYPGSSCHIRVVSERGDALSVPGSVVRCNHVGGTVHEVGIRFNEQISTKELLGLDPMQEAYSLEAIDPERLMGAVLVITDAELDRQLLLKFLETTSLNVDSARDAESALKRCRNGRDLILTDSHVGSESGAEIVMHLRSEGIDCPILVMTGDDTNKTRDEMRAAGASGYISKPLQRERLLQALAEFLLAEGDGGPLYSTLTPEDPAFELLTKFFSDIPRMSLTLEKAVKDEDERACRDICRTLSGTAAPLGFASVSELAAAAEDQLSATQSVRESASVIRQLIIACRRIKARPVRAA